MRPLISAVVLNYRTPRESVQCVRALQKQSVAEWMEIFVVDNHSKDDSIGFIRNTFKKTPRVRLLETPLNRGYGRGNALGLSQAQGEFILIINPDNELEERGLETMVDAMRSDPSIGIMGPKLIHEDGSVRDSYRTFPTPTDIFIKRTFLHRVFKERMRKYLQHDKDNSSAHEADWLAGACLLMRRDLYEKLGGFDPQFFLFFEDTDLCRRCWLAGRRVIYLPSVTATDRKHRLSEGGFFSIFTKWTVREHLKSAIKYFWKWRGT